MEIEYELKSQAKECDYCIGCRKEVDYTDDTDLAMNEKGLPICPDCQKREPFNIYKTSNQIIDESENMTFFLDKEIQKMNKNGNNRKKSNG